MKKIIVALMAIMMLAPAMVEAQGFSEKQIEKMAKNTAKKWKKEHRKLISSMPEQVVLQKHYTKLNDEDAVEYVGISTRTKSKNAGMQMAKNSAITSYAREAASTLKGRIVADMSANGSDIDGEFDHFYAAYESLVEKEINGEFKESMATIKDYGDGTFEIESYCIVSEKAATAARLRALNNALKETEAAQNYADKIAGFVREGF